MFSDAMFWRLVWKEYRVQRGLWLAILVLTPVVQLCPLLYSALSKQTPPPGTFVGIAAAAIAVYMLGCGATLFAAERETGTFDFQRSLPVDAWRVFLAKMGLAVVSGCALAVALTLLTQSLFVRQWLPDLGHYGLIGLVSTAEVFAWAVCFSLLLRQPLWAAFLGVLVPSAVTGNLLPGMSAIDWSWDVFAYHERFLGPRAVLAGLVLVMDTQLAGWWFRGRLENLRWRFGGSPAAAAECRPLAAVERLPQYTGGRRVGWSRLIWLTWRQSRWVAVALVALYVWALVSALQEDTSQRMRHPPYPALVTILASFALGLAAFARDQARWQFRLFAERGIGARWVWLSRQMVWLPLLAAMGLGAYLTIDEARTERWAETLLACFWIPLTCWAVAQFHALFVRSPVVAAVTALVSAILACLWTLLMIQGDVPFIWSVVPVPLVLLVATWLYAPYWVEERRNRRLALHLGLVLGVPAVCLAIAVPLRRAYQIPLVDPGFSVAEFTRPPSPSEQRTLDLYGDAWRRMGSYYASESPTRQPEVLQSALQLLNEAHQRPAVPLTLLREQQPAQDWAGPQPMVAGFVGLLSEQARAQEEAGDLDGAWQKYEVAWEVLRRFRWRASEYDVACADRVEADLLSRIAAWAARPQQTRERIQIVLTSLKDAEQQGLASASSWKYLHVALHAALRGERVSGDPANNPYVENFRNAVRVWRWLPWEACRIERMLNQYSQQALRTHAQYAAVVLSGSDQHDLNSAVFWGSAWLFPLEWEQQRWLNSTAMPPIYPGSAANSLIERTIKHRGTRLVLALVDWRREHGELPDSLDVLVGPYFGKLPVDPVTGESFLYFPQGLEKDVSYPNSEPNTLVANGRPFLWSPGRLDITVRTSDQGEREYLSKYWGHALSEPEALALGRLLPIPLPADADRSEEPTEGPGAKPE